MLLAKVYTEKLEKSMDNEVERIKFLRDIESHHPPTI